MRNRKIIRKYLVLLFLVIVFGFAILQVIIPDRAASETENRSLQQRPTLSVTQLTSGRFSSSFDTYINDQFPLRNGWLRIKTISDRVLGKTESNNIYLGHRGYLMEDFTQPSTAQYKKQLATLTLFAKNYPNVHKYMLVAPTAVNIYDQYLPAFAGSNAQNQYLDKLSADVSNEGYTFVDIRESFRGATDLQLYYQTDHHWTTDGAYTAFLEFANQAKLDYQKYSYDKLLVSDSFSGTLTASSGYRMNKTENLYVYLPSTEDAASYTINYVSEAQKKTTLFDLEKLDTRDKYAVFLGGNFPLLQINTTADSDKTLLLIKDSYANSFLPFLTEHYGRILVVDPRYYFDSLDTLMATENITDVLFLYNANTFASDTSLSNMYTAEE